jgi:hypothetical protein
MPYSGKVGDSIFINDLGGGHQYIIISKPNKAQAVIIVNFTAQRFDKDCTVTFRRRDHSRLFSKPTVVNYPAANFFPLSNLNNEASKPDSNYIGCPVHIVNRIIIGAFQSEWTPTGIQAELKEQYPKIAEKYYKEPTE